MKQLFLWIKPSPFGSTQVLAIPFLPGSVFISHQSFWHKELDLPTWFICSCFLDHENVASLFEVWRPWYQFKRWRMTFAFIRVPNYVLISGVGVEAMSSKAYYSAKRENGRHQMFFFFLLYFFVPIWKTTSGTLRENFEGIRHRSQQKHGLFLCNNDNSLWILRLDSVASITGFAGCHSICWPLSLPPDTASASTGMDTWSLQGTKVAWSSTAK